ncbi:MAG: signal peptide peptidase SppA [Woeseiaceae bacterium]
MQPNRPNIIVRFFSAIWRGFNALRKVLHFLLLATIFLFIFTVLAPDAPQLPERAALVINPQGVITEQLAGTPFDRAIDELTGQAVAQTLVRDVIDALEYAATDDRIGAVYLSTEGLMSGGITKLDAIAEAIEAFQSSGKPVIASGAYYSQSGFYLASFADEVYLDPNGAVLANGYGRFRNYYAEAIEKLSITWNVYKVGTHKSFVEPYTRNSMSDADRENSLGYLGQLWTTYVNDVTEARGLEAGVLQSLADDFDVELAKDNGDMAQTALRMKLVDGLMTATEMRQKMIALVGENENDDSTFSQIGFTEYVATQRLLTPEIEGDNVVAIVVASGSIVDGSAPPGQIGGDSTARLLRDARTDEKVQAVVLRVDSGGGSAFASDVILQEIENLKAAGKPVIASMGGVAASGGYWISMAADQIVAEPATITGSIGIFAMIPTFEDSLARLGVYTDGVGTAKLTNALRADQTPSEQVNRIMQMSIEQGYDQFISKVASYRGMEKSAVDAVAQGKVWSGVAALEFGLVDTLGDLNDAVSIAAERAGLDSYDTRIIEPELSEEEALLLNIIDGSARLGFSPQLLLPKRTRIGGLLGIAEQQLENIARFNDPRGIYLECFCEVD